MRQTRGLWASIALVAILVLASLVGFATGYLKPKLGLDLQGGVSVILEAPDNTDTSVMNQALDNIRNRVDAFGVGEPQIAVTGTTIDVQIPGGANGTIQEQQKTQYCLVSSNGTNYGCAPDQATAEKALKDLKVTPQPSQVCVEDANGQQLRCFGSQEEADTYKSSLTVAKKSAAPPSATPPASASPSAPSPSLQGTYCLADSTGTDVACYPTKKDADAAQKGLATTVAKNTYCVTDASGTGGTGALPTPTPSATPTAKATPSASPSPTPKPSTFSQLSFDGAESPPCGLKTQDDAATQLAAISVTQEDTQYCVISSAQENLGCYVSRTAAENRQRSTGQDHLLAVIGKTARLEQRPVLAVLPESDNTPVTCSTPADQDTQACSFDALKGKEVVYLDKGGQKVKMGPVVLSGDQITKATASLNPQNSQWQVDFTLNGEGKDSFSAATTAAVTKPAPQNQIAIVVDRQVISAPRVDSAITNGSGTISGGFSEQEAKDLATQLNAGALPVDLKLQSVQTISPTLGSESLHQGIVAGLVGLVLLFAYLLFYYRLLGIVAWVGMTIWAILALALVSLAGRLVSYSLTLAGVAGLVISLGVTADSYIVFYERLKDEVRGGKSPRSAVQPAFKRAYRTIVAADIVTMIAAVVLYVTAVSSVRGFALTLGVATLLDLFVVYFFKRPTVFLIARNDRLVNLHGFGLTSGVAAEPEPGDEAAVGVPGGWVVNVKHAISTYRGHTIPHFHFTDRRNVWFTFSGILIVLSLLGLLVRGLNFSIDFEGGAQITYTVVTPVSVGEVQGLMAENGRTDAEVQLVNGGQQVQIRTASLTSGGDSQALTEALAKQAGIPSDEINVKDVGPTWGTEIKTKAIRGLFIVLAAIAVYIAFRFEWKMAIGAMIALAHDLLITAGVYALVGREVTPETVIAILTILGFSLYDTVVIYDKIKENTESTALVSRLGYDGVVDLSLNQTVMRSVNTSLVVLLPILSLLLFGGETLKNFAFAMFIGVAIGAYSSIFIAAPVLTILKRREKRYRDIEIRRSARSTADARKTAPVAVAASAGASDAAAQRATARQGGGGARPRPKSKKRPPAKRKRR